MNEYNRKFLKRLSIVIGVTTLAASLLCLAVIPSASIIILLGGIVI